MEVSGQLHALATLLPALNNNEMHSRRLGLTDNWMDGCKLVGAVLIS